MKLKQLESFLGNVEVFANPKIALEQYPTSAHIASRMMYTAAHVYGDICGRMCVDVGCGTGMLGIAALALDAGHVMGIDVDQEALDLARKNIHDCCGYCCGEGDDHAEEEEEEDAEEEDAEEEEEVGVIPSVDLVQMDVSVIAQGGMPGMEGIADTVVTNPPFGTRKKGADVMFLQAAFRISRHAIYSLHKTSTRNHIGKVGKALGARSAEPIAVVRFDIPKSYAFHTHASKDVDVDIWRFEK